MFNNYIPFIVHLIRMLQFIIIFSDRIILMSWILFGTFMECFWHWFFSSLFFVESGKTVWWNTLYNISNGKLVFLVGLSNRYGKHNILWVNITNNCTVQELREEKIDFSLSWQSIMQKKQNQACMTCDSNYFKVEIDAFLSKTNRTIFDEKRIFLWCEEFDPYH